MAQVKKAAVRVAILDAAFRLFSERGYTATTITMIAQEAGVSTANVYVYFTSKFRIAYTLYDSWFRSRVEALRVAVETIAEPRPRLFALLHGLWCDIPAAENSFANCFMEAISTLGPEDTYEPTLLRWAEVQVGGMLRGCLPGVDPLNAVRLARVTLMAFDGFAIGRKLAPGANCDHPTIEAMVTLMLGRD